MYGANRSAAQAFDSARPALRVVDEDDQISDDWGLETEEGFEARLEGTNGNSVVRFTPAGGMLRSIQLPDNATSRTYRDGINQNRTSASKAVAGIKRRTPKQIKEDMPPTPRGCEWRRSDEGWNLWRYWSEPVEEGQGRIKKTRYTGHLSHDAWQIMKEYDHETFLSIVGQRLGVTHSPCLKSSPTRGRSEEKPLIRKFWSAQIASNCTRMGWLKRFSVLLTCPSWIFRIVWLNRLWNCFARPGCKYKKTNRIRTRALGPSFYAHWVKTIMAFRTRRCNYDNGTGDISS
jgi:hypothetical protein